MKLMYNWLVDLYMFMKLLVYWAFDCYNLDYDSHESKGSFRSKESGRRYKLTISKFVSAYLLEKVTKSKSKSNLCEESILGSV